MNKKKIIAIVGTLIAVCVIVAVSIPALGGRRGQGVAEPPVSTGGEKREDTGKAHDEDVTGPASNTTPNDVSGDHTDDQGQPAENEPANGDTDEGDGPEVPVDGGREEAPPEPTEAGKSGEEPRDDATPPAADEASDSEIGPQGEEDSGEEPTGAAGAVTDPAEPPEEDKTQPKVDPDDIPAGAYGPEVDVGTDPDEYGGLTPEEEEMIRQAAESTHISEEEEQRLRELFGEDGMSGY